MKNILKKKNIWLVSAIIIFSGLITYTVVQAATESGGGNITDGGSNTSFSGIPTDNINALDLIKPLIHVGGGQQFISGFLNLNGSHNGSVFDANSPDNKSSVFEKAQDANSFFAVIGNSWVGGRLFVGVPRYDSDFVGDIYNFFDFKDQLYSNGQNQHNWLKTFNYGSLGATLQKVNVQGEVLATNLIHQDGSDNLCISPEGSLVICSSSNYNWECSSIKLGLQNVVCKDSSNNIVADSLCPQPKPTTEELCSASGTSYTCTDTGWAIGDTTCSPINYVNPDDSDIRTPLGSSVCSNTGVSPLSCISSGTGGDTGGGGTTASGTFYDCALDGNWHRILVQCSPAISSPSEFFDLYGTSCGNQETRFDKVCFVSNPTVNCIMDTEPPCTL